MCESQYQSTVMNHVPAFLYAVCVRVYIPACPLKSEAVSPVAYARELLVSKLTV